MGFVLPEKHICFLTLQQTNKQKKNSRKTRQEESLPGEQGRRWGEVVVNANMTGISLNHERSIFLPLIASLLETS